MLCGESNSSFDKARELPPLNSSTNSIPPITSILKRKEPSEGARKSSFSYQPSSRQLIVRQYRSGQTLCIMIQISSITRIHFIGTSSALLVLSRPPQFMEIDCGTEGVDDAFDMSLFTEALGYDPSKPLPGLRLSSLNATHKRVAPFTSHNLNLVFPSPSELETFFHRRTQFHIARDRMSGSGITVNPQNIFSPTKLQELQSSFRHLNIRISVQLELLLRNNILRPSQIISILPHVQQLAAKYSAIQVEKILAVFVSHKLSSIEHREEDDPVHGEGDSEPTEVVALGAQIPSGSEQTTLAAQLRRAESVCSQSRAFSTLDDSYSFTRHVVITPTRLVLEGPILDQSNSILRRSSQPECYIRVSIREDNFDRMRHNPDFDVKQFLEQRSLPYLVSGLDLCGAVRSRWNASFCREHQEESRRFFKSHSDSSSMDGENCAGVYCHSSYRHSFTSRNQAHSRYRV